MTTTLDKLKELCENLTAQSTCRLCLGKGSYRDYDPMGDVDISCLCGLGALVTESRIAIPLLVAEVEKLREALDRLQAHAFERLNHRKPYPTDLSEIMMARQTISQSKKRLQ